MKVDLGTVALPFGLDTDATPVCGVVRYIWQGGTEQRGGVILVPGVVEVPVVDGVVESVRLSAGLWKPVLIIDGRRHSLPVIVVGVEPTPSPTPDITTHEDGEYELPAVTVLHTTDGAYDLALPEGWVFTDLSNGTYRLEQS
ncbi:hypothetical protein [Rothia mucilaginosa]|uniref:hypothetical protein n=1 Tax=Rothia mucilaginosa TaxID=43675 RepID=UPI003C709555